MVADPEVERPRADSSFKLAENVMFSRAGSCNRRVAGLHHATPPMSALLLCRPVPDAGGKSLRWFERGSRSPAIPCADSRCSKEDPPARRQHSVAAPRAADGEETRSV